MRSFRFRLVLGVALVATFPLALGMVLLSQRIAHTVRAQAAERLETALGSLNQRLAADAARVSGQLEILAREPALRRLVLLRPAGDRDLADYLAERRFLLGLDFLSVTDTSGTLIADAAPIGAPARPAELAWRELAIRRSTRDSVALDTLAGTPAMVLAAGAPIEYETLRAGSLVGGRALDAALLAQLSQASGIDLTLRDAAGRTVATTLADPVPAPEGAAVQRVDHGGRSYLGRSIVLAVGPPPRPSISGFVATEATDQTIAALRWASALLAALGLAIAMLLGLLWSWRISRPVERLADYSGRLARGEWEAPLELRGVRELETLAEALDRMRLDLRAYRDRLRVSERHAAWSQMARAVAHEVKNPLTPIAVSVADLRRSYELGRPDFPQILDQAARTIAEEVESLKRMLQEFSDFARLPAPRFERCRVSELLAGLEALYAADIEAGRMSVAHADRDATIEADPGQLRQALVNLIKNALEAIGGEGRVTVAAAADGDALEVVVADTGPGLGPEQRANLFVPGFSTKSEGRGLGLTIVERIVNDHHGTIAADSAPGRGTTFRIRLPLEQPAPAPGGAHDDARS